MADLDELTLDTDWEPICGRPLEVDEEQELEKEIFDERQFQRTK